ADTPLAPRDSASTSSISLRSTVRVSPARAWGSAAPGPASACTPASTSPTALIRSDQYEGRGCGCADGRGSGTPVGPVPPFRPGTQVARARPGPGRGQAVGTGSGRPIGQV